MSIDRLVTVYENDYGEKAYQPTLPDGTRLVYDYSASWAGEPPGPVWTKIVPVLVSTQRPVLYRSERRAHRKAAREQARRDKRKRQTFREVQSDEQ